MTEKKKEFDVVADILRVAALGSKESELIVGCDLERSSLEKYMPVMMLLKLVSVKKESENFYRTTSKGLEFLRFYHGLRWLLWGKDLDYVLINIMNKLKKEKKAILRQVTKIKAVYSQKSPRAFGSLTFVRYRHTS